MEICYHQRCGHLYVDIKWKAQGKLTIFKRNFKIVLMEYLDGKSEYFMSIGEKYPQTVLLMMMSLKSLY